MAILEGSLLSAVTFLPLLGAFLLILIPRQSLRQISGERCSSPTDSRTARW